MKHILYTALVGAAIFTLIPNPEVATTLVAKAQVGDGNALLEFFKAHFKELIWGLIAFIEVIVRLTPTDKDNSVYNWVKGILDVILPNRATKGGYHD